VEDLDVVIVLEIFEDRGSPGLENEHGSQLWLDGHPLTVGVTILCSTSLDGSLRKVYVIDREVSKGCLCMDGAQHTHVASSGRVSREGIAPALSITV
jgi:hypothetical protein